MATVGLPIRLVGHDGADEGSSGVRVWKVLGVAGLAGVAATGVAVARAERRRRAYEPDDVRARLHQRHQEAVESGSVPPPEPAGPERGRPVGCLRAVLGRVVPRRRRRR